MKYTDVVTMINGHTAATVNGKRLVFTPEQWLEVEQEEYAKRGAACSHCNHWHVPHQLRENDCVSCGRDRNS